MTDPKKPLKVGMLYRDYAIPAEAIDADARTVDLSFSSELAYERWFGKEILDHGTKSIRLGRLNDGAAVLVNHDPEDHVGVVEKAYVGKDRTGRAMVRFGKSARADEIFNDVKDGIRKLVSVGYRIHKVILESEEEGDETYRVTDWEPYEISLVAIPADPTVGVGRAAEEFEVEVQRQFKEQDNMQQATNTPAPAAVAAAAVAAAAPAAAAVDVRVIEDNARRAAGEAETTRIREITAMGAKFKREDMARLAINEGTSIDAFRSKLLADLGDSAPLKPAESADIGLTRQELQRYSFLRLMNALANPTDQAAQRAAGFEFECSRATLDREKRSLRQGKGMGAAIPVDVLRAGMDLQRDLIVTTGTMGGNLVQTDVLGGSFIDLLRAKIICAQLGATMLTGLNGNVAIPRQSGGATAYWVAENSAPTESQLTIDQVTLTPKTVGAFSDYSRRLLIQSSVDVENMVRSDLAKVLAIAIDLAAILGPGTANQPSGILTSTSIGSSTGGAQGGTVAWSNIVDLEAAVATANADIGSLAYMTNPKQRGNMKKVVKSTSAVAGFIWDGGDFPVNGYKCGVSSQAPTNLVKGTTSTCSPIIFGNWADLLIGMWSGLDVLVDPYTGSTAGTVRVVALQDVDVNLRHPESFAAMKDAL